MLTRAMKQRAFDFIVWEQIVHKHLIVLFIIAHILLEESSQVRRRTKRVKRYSMIGRMPEQISRRSRLYLLSDSACVQNLRMDRNAFARLCYLMRQVGGLKDQKYVLVEEQVAMFLSILAHHTKNCVVKFEFFRSGQTVSRYIHLVLKAILKLHHLFLVRPTPIPDNSTDPRWKWFKGCLGALDGTYIDLTVPSADRGRYRTRKGRISTNVLAVCDPHMKFVYVLPGWEGSAADCRVLRDAINRPQGLKVPKGNYYLGDNGYANSEGFLVPYRSIRYHLSEWGPHSGRPTNKQEHFNMRHTRARNVIERAFGVLKKRFGILSSPSFYPLKIQIRLIMTCFLLHNFIRTEMPIDPIEQDVEPPVPGVDFEDNDAEAVEYIDTLDSTPEFNLWRDELATSMYNDWRSAQP